ncbi:MAG: hypothetical protein ACJ8F7_08300 [Gemmataceae bacterium]
MSRCIFALSLLLGALPLAAHADIPPNPRGRPVPQPIPQPGQSKFVVEVDAKAKEARLVVPRGLVGRAGLDVDGEDRLAGSGPRTAPVVAGVALALGMTCGGLWLVRRHRAGARSVALLIATGTLLAGGALVWGNAAPPPREPALPQLYDGKITVEVAAGGDTIKLIVAPGLLTKLGKQPAPGSPAPPGASGSAPPVQTGDYK